MLDGPGLRPSDSGAGAQLVRCPGGPGRGMRAGRNSGPSQAIAATQSAAAAHGSGLGARAWRSAGGRGSQPEGSEET